MNKNKFKNKKTAINKQQYHNKIKNKNYKKIKLIKIKFQKKNQLYLKII